MEPKVMKMYFNTLKGCSVSYYDLKKILDSLPGVSHTGLGRKARLTDPAILEKLAKLNIESCDTDVIMQVVIHGMTPKMLCLFDLIHDLGLTYVIEYGE